MKDRFFQDISQEQTGAGRSGFASSSEFSDQVTRLVVSGHEHALYNGYSGDPLNEPIEYVSKASTDRIEFAFSSGLSLPVTTDQAPRLIFAGHELASHNGYIGNHLNEPIEYVHHGRQENGRHVAEFRSHRANISAISTPPRYPDYIEHSDRLRSYARWPHRMPDPYSLTKAGFFFANDVDLVRCYQCGIGLKDFCEKDDPLKEHVRHSGNCPYLQQHLGAAQLAELKRQLQTEDPEYIRQMQWNARHTLDPATTNYRHPEYQTLQSRLSSFRSWPQRLIHTPQQLADAGLFYTGFEDRVRCFACDGELQRWDPDDDPWTEHCRWFPASPFARQQKGDEYIAVIQAAVAYENQGKGTQSGDRGLSCAMEQMVLREPEFRAALNEHRATCVEMGYQLEDFIEAVQELQNRGTIKPTIEEVIDAIEVIKARRVQEEALQAIQNGFEDRVPCFAYDRRLQRWDLDNDPWTEHCCWFPACPFARQQKGDEYIAVIQAAIAYKNQADVKIQRIHRNFLLTNRGAHAYNGNGRTLRSNTRASKELKKGRSCTSKRKESLNTAKSCRKTLKLQFHENNTEALQGQLKSRWNFRKSSVTLMPLPARLVVMSAKVINSVGVLEGGSATGTLFRVGDRFGMTAAHVIDAITNPHMAKGQDDLNQLTHCSVRFCEQKQIYRLKPVVHFKDRKLDAALVEFLDEDLCRLPPPLQLVKYDVSTTLKAAVIIGYSPEQPGVCLEPGVDVLQQRDVPKEEITEFLSKNQKTFRTVLKIMGSCANIVETGYSGCEADTNMLLNCFLGPGASGSPVFTTQFQETLKVAGIFICGYPKMFYEFPESVQKKFPLEYTFEAATKTSAIYKSLCKRNKKLAEDIFGC